VDGGVVPFGIDARVLLVVELTVVGTTDVVAA
jgi:hypothetical protein